MFKLVDPKKSFSLALCFVFIFAAASVTAFAQDRERVVTKSEKTVETKKIETRPTTRLPASPKTRSQGLTNRVVVVGNQDGNKSLVKKTASVASTREDVSSLNNRLAYGAVTKSMMMQSIRSKIGLRYRYGSQGPITYDCSGFIWKVFEEAGISFTRTSARQFWRTFEPVYGQDRFKFGTLVFLNKLGHVGIVADENGFYHASSSKGVTYSPFKGYWAKRIVGFRRVPVNQFDSETR